LEKVAGMTSRGFGRAIAPAHPELFFDGQPMTVARWPNGSEWARIAGFPRDQVKGDDHGGELGVLTGGFQYEGDRPRGWAKSDDIWVHGYWAWDWANSYERIERIELEQRLVRTASPHGLYGFRKGQRFYFLNVLEELDEPGEWYLDRVAGRLYFWPPAPGLDVSEVILSFVETPLISMDDVSHVTFRGLILEAGRSHGISVRGGRDNVIAGCAIHLMGNYGVWIEGGQAHAVRSCDIENTGGCSGQRRGASHRAQSHS
jgi:hypothetical protein